MCCGVSNAFEIDELSFVKELHLWTVQKLGLDRSVLFNSGSSSSETSSGGTVQKTAGSSRLRRPRPAAEGDLASLRTDRSMFRWPQ